MPPVHPSIDITGSRLACLHRRIWRALRMALTVALGVLLLAESVLPPADFTERVRAFTRSREFDFVAWTMHAWWIKWTQASLGGGRFLTQQGSAELVVRQLDITSRLLELEVRIRDVYGDPQITDAEHASVDLRSERDALRRSLAFYTPLAESAVQNQLAVVLEAEGLAWWGNPIPPVRYRISAPPNALIVSPRTVIRQDANVMIDPDMSLEEIVSLEDGVARTLDVSALVDEIGGIGLYPTMVMQTTNINALTEIVSHEWIHNHLTLRPLGLSYDLSPELRTMNETAASIAGIETGRALVAAYYPQFLPPQQPEAPVQEGLKRAPPAQHVPAPFNFNRIMHQTRLKVDALLAEGRVSEAETVMEIARRYLWENGYQIRRLNQAYFAFHGAYAESEEGAAGADPVGEAVRDLRRQSPSLAAFIERISWMASFADLQSAVQK